MISSKREGFALAATIMAMLVVGAIVTGGFYAASHEGQVARSFGNADDALYIAETGINAGVAQATAAWLDAIPHNTSVTDGAVDVTVGSAVLGNYVNTIVRVADGLFVIRSTGTVTRGGRYAGATRTVANMIRVRTADFNTRTAVMIYGDLKVGGTSDIDGTDVFPSSWTTVGCATDAGTSAVVTNPSTTVTTQGSGQITGPVMRDTLTSDNFSIFGDLTWNELVAMADKQVGGTVGPGPVWSGSTCTVSANTNWGSGQPGNPCFNYFPIIYADESLLISSSGEGQGILLVEGDLDISGGFNFYGVAVVLGEIKMTGTGGHVNGTTLVFGGGDIDSSSSTVGNSLLQYSSCAIERAVLNNSNLARAVPIAHRSWMDVSAIRGGN